MWKKQPWKLIYVIYDTITSWTIRYPLWFLLAIPRSNRTRPSWTIKRTFMVRVLKHIQYVRDKVGGELGSPDHTAISTLPGTKGLWITPVPHLVTGDLKTWVATANIQCIPIPGYWLDRPNSSSSPLPLGSPPQPGEKVLYHLHGGGYVILSAHPSDPTSSISRGIMEYTPTILRTFSVEYRLTTGPPKKPHANPFPTALVDALAGYNYLVNEVGFKPEDIIVEGDSAGGNLALQLTRYLVENQKGGDDGVDLPGPPGELILCSPWTDLGSSHVTPGSSTYTNLDADFINTTTPQSLNNVANIVHPFGRSFADTNRYVSPASKSPEVEGQVTFKGFPRTVILAGGAEILVDQIRTLKERMVRDLGEGMVEYVEAADAIHDYLALQQEPERTETLKRIGKWLVL